MLLRCFTWSLGTLCFESSSPPAMWCQTSRLDGSLQGHTPFGGTSLHGTIQPCCPCLHTHPYLYLYLKTYFPAGWRKRLWEPPWLTTEQSYLSSFWHISGDSLSKVFGANDMHVLCSQEKLHLNKWIHNSAATTSLTSTSFTLYKLNWL